MVEVSSSKILDEEKAREILDRWAKGELTSVSAQRELDKIRVGNAS